MSKTNNENYLKKGKSAFNFKQTVFDEIFFTGNPEISTPRYIIAKQSDKLKLSVPVTFLVGMLLFIVVVSRRASHNTEIILELLARLLTRFIFKICSSISVLCRHDFYKN